MHQKGFIGSFGLIGVVLIWCYVVRRPIIMVSWSVGRNGLFMFGGYWPMILTAPGFSDRFETAIRGK